MDDKLIQAAIAMMTATVGLALVAVIVSKNSNTTGVVQAFASGYTSILSTVLSPVTGSGDSSSGSMNV